MVSLFMEPEMEEHWEASHGSSKLRTRFVEGMVPIWASVPLLQEDEDASGSGKHQEEQEATAQNQRERGGLKIA